MPFAVFRNPEGYARFTDFSRDGAVFWPFMMASAMGWVRFAGRHHKGGNWINVEALSDAQVEAVRRVIQDGLRTADIHTPGTTKVDTAAMGGAIAAAL